MAQVSQRKSPVIQVQKDSKNLPVYTLDDVAKHNKKDDCWVVIDKAVYDISSWVPQHPGGWLIAQGFGRECTVLFETSHPLYVKKQVLPKYKIGTLKRDDKLFDYNWNSEFYKVLKTRVEKHFKKANKSIHGSLQLWFQTIFTLVGFLYFYSLAIEHATLFYTILAAWFYSQIGLQIMHDGNHGAFSGSPFLCRLAGMTMDIIGASSYVWKHEHNIGHHQFTNTMTDPDASAGSPFIRFHPSQKWNKLHRVQHLYTWIAYCFVALKWYISDVGYTLSGMYRHIPMYPASKSEVLLMLITKLNIVYWMLILPIQRHGLFQAGGLILIGLACISFFFALQFAPTHIADDVIFPEEFKSERDWAKLQVMSTSNYSVDSFLATWFSAGLNYQIEHHLFPTLAHTNLPEIAPIVKETCKEFHVPYFSHSSYWEALKHHYNHLKRMSVPPSEATPFKLSEMPSLTIQAPSS